MPQADDTSTDTSTDRTSADPLDALPPGLTTRPLRMDDAADVTALMAAEELANVGRVLIQEADIVGDWSRPSHDLAGNSIGVLDGDRLVAYGEVAGSFHCDAAVHPDHHGRGIGTAIALWTQRRAAELGHEWVGMPNPVGSPGERLLRALGYEERWRSWGIELPEGARVPERRLPDGYAIAPASTDADREGAWHVTEDAFLEWSERPKDSYADWAARVTERPGFEPWMLRVVHDPAGAVVGAVSLQLAGGAAYVDKLAVRKGQRGRGLAQALLVDAFAAGRAHGAERSELSTDSRTGALDLYLKIGMVVHDEWVHLAKRLSS